MIRLAEISDIPRLIKLVNAAYRGEQSRKGWTTPANLVAGEIRVDEESLTKMFQKPSSVILKFILDQEIVGCVHLEKQGNDLYLGLLSVWPDLQGKNIGKNLLAAAEVYGRENKLENIVMNVISKQQDLIDWYERHGYTVTADTKPFPEKSKFGTPREKLEFIVLKKELKNY